MDAGVSLSGLQVPIWPINWQNRDKNVLTQSDWWAVHCWRYRSRDRVQCLGTGQHIWIVKCVRLTKNTPKIFGSYKYYWFTNSYDQMLDYYLTASVCTRYYKWSSESKFVNFLTKAVSVDPASAILFSTRCPINSSTLNSFGTNVNSEVCEETNWGYFGAQNTFKPFPWSLCLYISKTVHTALKIKNTPKLTPDTYYIRSKVTQIFMNPCWL